ncbi:MAG: hypothetical protein L0206_25955, partial [Actinobacteria bacterium]|nr:hypothetical protein [Actinomycetota bacterium]
MRISPLPLVLLSLAAAAPAAQSPPPHTAPVRRGSGWAEPWQGRFRLSEMLEVNLATGNLVCSVTTGRFYYPGLPPHHEVALAHNSERAATPGDFTGGFGLGPGWSSNLGVTLAFPGAGVAELTLGDGKVVEFTDQGGVWVPQAGSFLKLEGDGGGGWTVVTGRQWRLRLDALGRLTAVESSEGNRYDVTWGVDGVSAATEPSGRGATFGYDPGTGRLDSVTDPAGVLWSLSYDASGRLGAVTNANYGTVAFTYDGAGRIQTFSDYETQVWQFEYWGWPWIDRIKKVTYPGGAQASFAYAGLGDHVVTSVTDLRGGVWKSVHDVAESPAQTSAVDPLGNAWTFVHDAQRLLESETNPLGKTWAYDHDANGNLTSVTDPLQRVTEATYDALNRLTQVQIDGDRTLYLYEDEEHPMLVTRVVEPPVGGGTPGITGADYFGPLDGSAPGEWNGHLDELSDGEGVSTRFDYDSLGRIAAEHEGPASAAGGIEAAFDQLEGPTYADLGGMGYPAPFPTLPAPPAALQGRLDWMIAPGGSWTWRGQYDVQSFDVTVPIDSGAGWETSNVTRTFAYDHVGRLVSLAETSEETLAHVTNPPATPPVRAFTVTHHDAAPDARTEVIQPGGDTWIWRRDAANRITSVSRAAGGSEQTVATNTYFADGSL